MIEIIGQAKEWKSAYATLVVNLSLHQYHKKKSTLLCDANPTIA